MFTTIDQLSEVYYTSAGEVRFRVTTSFVDLKEGDLPYANIFVYGIVAANDPKADSFQRIANIGDLTTLPISRESAVTQGVTSYLTSSFSVSYGDVQTATSAKQLIQSRIDQLIADWKTYREKFIAPRETDLPAANTLVVQSAKNAYYAAASDQAKKQDASTAAAAAYTTKSQDLASSLTAQTKAQNALLECNQVKALLDAGANPIVNSPGVIEAYSALRTAVQVFLDAHTQTGATRTVAEAAFTTMVTALGASSAALTTLQTTSKPNLQQAQTLVTQSCSARTVDLQTATSAVATSTAAANTANLAWKKAESDAAAAVVAAEAALAAALDVCPDFTP
jgi:hypothetical protein